MALEINRSKKEVPMAFVADRRLCLTQDKSRVVEEGDPSSAWLLVPAGGEVSEEAAKAYGLTVQDGKVVLPGTSAPPEKQEEKPPDGEKSREKTEDKAAKKGEDKSSGRK